MTTVKQICLGVAVAGVVAGAGSVCATAVANAEPTASDSPSTADSGSADSSRQADKRSRKERRADETDNTHATSATSDTDAADNSDKIDKPRVRRASPAAKEADAAAEDTDSQDPGDPDTESGQDADSDSDSTDPGPEPAASPAPAADEDVEDASDDVAVAPRPAVLSSYTPSPYTPTRSPKQPPLPVPFVPAAPASSTSASTSSSSTTRNRSTSTADVAAQIADPTTQHVLVIGVDGTNLSRVLDDPGNAHFLELMNTGTTGPASIVGHTTISNPSWTTILTGVWDTKSGVINNVFTPRTYDTWPTVFNQLEAANPNLNTKAIANWQVITDIAGAGSHPADTVVYIPNNPADPTWSQSDAAVTAETVSSIVGGTAGYEDVPNFLFTYLAQVDEAGHQYGGASPEYAAALARTNTNIGLILAAVAEREAATGEDWTVIVVTDHGHQPQQGFGHGFQSPDETATFVIVDGPGFADGQMNLKYSIADITPTVVSLFGIAPTVDADGVPLTQHGDSQVDPVDLEQAVNDAIDMYGWPDIATNVALSVRTIVATVPYYVDNFFTGVTSQLQEVASQGIFVISDLAAIAVFPVQLTGDVVYALTDLLAQIVGRLTGAGVIPPSTSPSTAQRDGQPYPWVLV
ncbi:alkaline phosphatase family protein [Mycolicibacterium mengxianglii]|uniref:alkaline phosphatase family protein n=1 Tax=Mycolicibacterium mengxianglii TaxID=2736649 RepID=UPI0018D1CB99|nr:alkaline phosphatase family protein [Mycolicibacterium mengxianglii]